MKQAMHSAYGSVRPILSGLTWAVAAQVLLIVATMLNGILLARGTTLELRGFIVIFSITLTLVSVIATLGLPDLVLRHTGRLPSFRTSVCGLALFSLLGLLFPLFLPPPGESVSGLTWAFVAVLVVCSLTNSVLFNLLIVRRGLKVTSWMRCGYALLLAGSIAIAYGYSDSELTWAAVVSSMLVAESLTTGGLLFLLWNQPWRGVPPDQLLPARSILREGPRYALAALGTATSQRGVIILAGVTGGLPATALLSVAQNAASPIGLPVSALATQIQLDAALPAKTKAPWAKVSICLTVAAAAAAVPLNYWMLVPLYGPEYARLQPAVFWISIYGLLAGLWRIQHLRLRGSGQPGAAFVSDVVALLAFAALAFGIGFTATSSNLLPIMCAYVGAGLTVTCLQSLNTRGRSRDAAT